VSTGAPPYGARFADALQYAWEIHRHQRRKGSGTPYFAHLLAVAGLVMEQHGSEDEAIAALLHDAVEDGGGEVRQREIAVRFGDEVARIVAACSDTTETPKPPFRARKEAHVAHMTACDGSVRLVMLADKLHNAQSVLEDFETLGDALWERFSGRREGTLWYYAAMTDALDRGDGHPLHRRLREIVEKLETRAAHRDQERQSAKNA